MKDFRTIIDSVRQRTDLAELIGRDVALEPAGSVLKGRSPFRPDKNPSFVVWPHTQTWRDFSGGSSLGGDCLDYVMERHQVGFWEALKLLAAESNVPLPVGHDPVLEKELGLLSERRRIEGLLTEAARYYHGVLPTKLRLNWLEDRYGFTDQTIDDLLLGYANGHLYQHFRETLKVSEADALKTGLFVRLGPGRISDFFQDRLVFPYWRSGRVVYFIARKTELTADRPWEQPKYKKLLTHSEKHPYVSTFVQNDTFYNEDAALTAKGQSLLVTEGVTDCIAAMQAKVPCISPVTVRFRKRDIPKLLTLTEGALEVVICNDSEQSGAGDAGALETASELQRGGRMVRIAHIPRDDGEAKVDLNAFLKREGRVGLTRIIRQANDWVETKLNQIPPDVSKHQLAASLGELVPLIKASGPILQDGYQDLIRRRFKLRADTVRSLFKQPDAQSTASNHDSQADFGASQDGPVLKGEVFEETDHYYILGRRGEPIPISTFALTPTRRITTEEGDVFDTQVTTVQGRSYKNVRFPRDSWNSKRAFLRALKSADMLWTGSDDNVQGVLRLLTDRPVPTYRGITNLGYIEIEGQAHWVVPEGVVSAANQGSPPEDICYIDTGGVLHHRLRPLKSPSKLEEAALAQEVLPALLDLNLPEVILPILGWFFAAPLKPRIQKALGHFPSLCVWGTQGSGKSSIIMEVFWPLMGLRSTEPFSATETEFALLKLLSSTSSIPVFIDEYKPFDMPRHRRNTLHRTMRRLYTGEVESRGRQDQSVVSYRLQAPLCLAGETRPIESALVERIVTANPSKDTLPEHPECVRAFKKLKSLDLGSLTPSLIRHLLSRDTERDLALAQDVVESLLKGREVPLRMRDNLIATVVGLIHYEGFAESLGVSLPELAVEKLVHGQCDDLLESGGHSVKTGLDYFLEILSSLAISGDIEEGRQYTYSTGHLALHVPSCHAAYAEFARRTGYEAEVLDKKALSRQLKENARRGGYVKDASRTVSFGSRTDKRRAALIDLEAAKALLDVDDFPQAGEVSTYQGRWGNYH